MNIRRFPMSRNVEPTHTRSTVKPSNCARFSTNFRLSASKIPNIGPAKQATLLSYGIETAADVNMAAVLRVPEASAQRTPSHS